MVEGGRKEKPSAALARTRPVFRGLRPGCDLAGLTPGCWPPLQGRDPFSGDCDEEEILRVLLGDLRACKDETRFQGIATGFPSAPSQSCSRFLQGRDPFSGDCDCEVRGRLPEGEEEVLQGRDPFSGDCDVKPFQEALCGVEQLARTRPVFRGLRRRAAVPSRCACTSQLARTRPVFRGLRPATPAWADPG